MKKKQLDISKLEENEGKILTANELNALGFVAYDIKLLEQEKYLLKVKRGHYYSNPRLKEVDISLFNTDTKLEKGKNKKQLNLTDLEILDGETIRTSDLIDLGFNTYDIKTLVTDGRLLKLRQGHYYINVSKKEIDPKTLISLSFNEAKKTRQRKEHDLSKLEDKDFKTIETNELKELGYSQFIIKSLEEAGYLLKIKRGSYFVNIHKKELDDKKLKSLIKEKKPKRRGQLDVAKLEVFDGQTIQASQIKELGYEPHHIKALAENGYLIKKGYGKYLVNPHKKQINCKVLEPIIIELENNIKAKDYKRAYNNLVAMCKNKIDNSYDQYIFLYFTLLRPLLGSKSDFTYADKLTPTSVSLDGDILVTSNRILKEMSDLLTLTLEQESILEEKKREFNSYYKEFTQNIKLEDYVAALTSINNCINSSYSDSSKEIANMLHSLIVVILDLRRKKKISLPKENIEYKDYSNPYMLVKMSLENNDYAFAYKVIDEYKLGEEKKAYKVIKYLLAKILNMKKEETDTKDETKAARNAEMTYKLFLTCFYKDDYIKAKEYLKSILNGQNPIDKKSKEYRLYTLLTSYIKMRREKLSFPNKGIDYSGLTSTQVFELALDNQDYKVAFKNIGKLTYQNNDQLLDVYKIILHKMHDVDKIVRDKINEEQRSILYPKPKGPVFTNISSVDYKVSKDQSEKAKNQESASYVPIVKPLHKSSEVKVGEIEKGEVSKSTSKQITPRKSLEYQELYSLIQEGKYEEIYSSLDYANKNKLNISREEYIIYSLIKMLNELRAGKDVTSKEGYLEDRSNYFKSFFQSINFRNIEDIKYYFELCYDKAKDREELDLYRKIIEDIIAAQGVIKEKEELNNKISQINAEIKAILDKKENLTNEEIDKLYELMNKKGILGSEANEIAHSILSAIDSANNKYVRGSKIDEEYYCVNYVSGFDSLSFASFSGDVKLGDEEYISENPLTGNEDKDQVIINLLNNGAYLDAYQILQSDNITNTLKEYAYDDKIIIRSLLGILNGIVNKPYKPADISNESIQDIDDKRELEELHRLIKKRDFYGAYNYAINSDLDLTMLKEIMPELFILFHDDVTTEENLALDFLDHVESDLNQARVDIINYQELLDRTSMGQKDEYQEVLEEMNKKYNRAKAKK